LRAVAVLGVAYFGAVNVFCLKSIMDSLGLRLALHAVLPNVFHCGILFLMCSCWSKLTSLLCYGVIPGSGMYILLQWQISGTLVL
jgi:hypothetical protein